MPKVLRGGAATPLVLDADGVKAMARAVTFADTETVSPQSMIVYLVRRSQPNNAYRILLCFGSMHTPSAFNMRHRITVALPLCNSSKLMILGQLRLRDIPLFSARAQKHGMN